LASTLSVDLSLSCVPLSKDVYAGLRQLFVGIKGFSYAVVMETADPAEILANRRRLEAAVIPPNVLHPG
jgi:hypothetical protein